jgi:hypothetical protein
LNFGAFTLRHAGHALLTSEISIAAIKANINSFDFDGLGEVAQEAGLLAFLDIAFHRIGTDGKGIIAVSVMSCITAFSCAGA